MTIANYYPLLYSRLILYVQRPKEFRISEFYTSKDRKNCEFPNSIRLETERIANFLRNIIGLLMGMGLLRMCFIYV